MLNTGGGQSGAHCTNRAQAPYHTGTCIHLSIYSGCNINALHRIYVLNREFNVLSTN